LNEGAAGFARGLWELYFYALANGVAWRGVERRLVVFEVRRGAPSALEKAGGADFDGVGQSEGVGFIAGLGDHEESLGRSLIIAKIIEGSLMTCRIEMAVWEHGVAEKREKCAR
jgi:hypothetical protein